MRKEEVPEDLSALAFGGGASTDCRSHHVGTSANVV